MFRIEWQMNSLNFRIAFFDPYNYSNESYYLWINDLIALMYDSSNFKTLIKYKLNTDGSLGEKIA
jgi:hypothetical protein